MSRRACTALLLLAAAGAAVAADCPLKGFAFIAAAKDSMWPVVTALRSAGAGGCTVVGDALVAGGAADGTGVTCEATFFPGAKLKDPWKLKKIRFAGAQVAFTPAPAFPSASAQVTVQVQADAAAALSLSVQQVLLTTTDANCKNWRNAFKE